MDLEAVKSGKNNLARRLSTNRRTRCGREPFPATSRLNYFLALLFETGGPAHILGLSNALELIPLFGIVPIVE